MNFFLNYIIILKPSKSGSPRYPSKSGGPKYKFLCWVGFLWDNLNESDFVQLIKSFSEFHSL